MKLELTNEERKAVIEALEHASWSWNDGCDAGDYEVEEEEHIGWNLIMISKVLDKMEA